MLLFESYNPAETNFADNCNWFVHTHFNYLEPFGEATLTLGATEEIYESPERGTEDRLHATLNALKPQVLTALNNRTYLNSLHKTLALKLNQQHH